MGKKIKQTIQIDGYEIELSNPDKLLFPQSGITKWDYLLYLTQIGPYLLPYTQNRLLTTIRYPDGVDGEHFYQKNCPKKRPDFVNTVWVDETEYILLNNLPTLAWLANLACLEFHVSFHYASNMNAPTEVVFDLDPSTSEFGPVQETALQLHQVLQSLGLHAFPKTSGATGLQVYIPIENRYTFDQTRKVTQFIARYLAERFPKLITVERLVKDRGDKVYVDYLQHWTKKSLIAPYSPRARSSATVSAPLEWDELAYLSCPTEFTLPMMIKRIQQKGDLFATMVQGPKESLDDILSFVERQ
ncbi:non-homologous end-joining DNA ligase [Baia soyae]|uniref:Bifunctional non-homologous end joining protein LigD n=1 Tax=Baia soyae TaxID=1544746 RepID=A0A4R2RWF7_9BACL|nr:non-homologous end-joining DNA ligase [Baia soyae]TCP67077.1 bifunctional non-homologous end joining protein LigD [Baia soyae]